MRDVKILNQTELICKIDGISHNGEGVGRINGKVVFVPGAIPGEEITCKLLHESRSLMRAALIDVIAASPYRVEPGCPYYGRCGGCSYQHMSYEKELACKGQVVEQQLRRIGGQQCEVQPVIGMDDPWSYRNKVEWQLFVNESGGASLGYINVEQGGPVPINACRLLKPSINELSMALHRQAGILYMAGVQRIGIRWSDTEHSLMLNLFSDNTAAVEALLPQLEDVLEQAATVNVISHTSLQTLQGPGYTMEKAAGLNLKVSPLSFFQVNQAQSERLFKLLRDMAGEQNCASVVDAYCGTGVMALALADRADRLTGIENYPGAIQDARENARLNNIENCDFLEGFCEDVIPDLQPPCDLLLLDPPRAGCKPPVLQAVLKLNPARIIYVSCNPATLARDLKILTAGGYRTEMVQPLDMFPRTWHIETVVLLSRTERATRAD